MEQGVQIFMQILNGLDSMHRSSILHRCLNPSNIFMVDGAPKLGDLNICKDLDEQIKSGQDAA